MNILMDSVTFYVYELFYSLLGIISPAVLYVQLTIIIAIFLFAGCKLRDFGMQYKLLGRPLFCAILQSLAVFMMYGLLIARALQGFAIYSIPIIIDELQCILIIIFSFFYARSAFTWFSRLWGTLLFIFAWPIIGAAIHIISVYVLFSPEMGFYEGNISLRGAIIACVVLLFLAIIQTASIWLVSRDKYKISWTIKSLFILFVANLGAGLIVRGLFLVFKLFMPNAIRAS